MRKDQNSTGAPRRYPYGSDGQINSDYFGAGSYRRQTHVGHGRAKLGTLDDNSEEHILQDLSAGKQITKTTNVRVAYEERSNGGD